MARCGLGLAPREANRWTTKGRASARQLVSQAPYTRHRGVSRQYITRLAKAGVLVVCGGKVDVAAADAVLDHRPEKVSEAATNGPVEEGAQTTSYARAKLADMLFRAQLRKLGYKTRSAKLILTDEVKIVWFKSARQIRDKLLAVPAKLAPQLAAVSEVRAVREQLAAGFEPPPRQTVSEWADQNRWLSSAASAEPGPWRTDRAPYQLAILDALTPNSPYERVVMMAAAQTGKTEVTLTLVGYIIDRDPGPMLVVLPRVEDGEAWSKNRLAPMLRHTPCLVGKVADVRSRDSNNRILHKQFQGGSITIAGANSPAGLAMRPIRYVLLDEVDRYPASAGTEGDPVSLAIKRSATWWNRKILLASTPTVKGSSRIESWWLRSNQSSYWVPCPECGAYQVLVWPNLEWPEGRPEEARYRCTHCGVLIAPHRKPWMLARGEWRAANPKSKIAGFWISQLYSPWKEWPETAAEVLEAKHGGPETLRAFINTALGELWDDEAETSVEVAAILNRRNAFGSRVPAGVCVLTAGIDLQVDRAELELVCCGRGGEFFEQLLSEVLVTSYARGVLVREWRRKKGVRG